MQLDLLTYVPTYKSDVICECSLPKIKIVKFTLKIQWKSEKTILSSSRPNAETLIQNLSPMTNDIACLLFDPEDSDFELHGQGKCCDFSFYERWMKI